MSRAEADVALTTRVVALEGLLGREGTGPHQVHDVALLELEVAAGVDDHVGQAVALFGDVVVVSDREIERLHTGTNKVGNLGTLDLLGVVVPSLVAGVDRVLKNFEEIIIKVREEGLGEFLATVFLSVEAVTVQKFYSMRLSMRNGRLIFTHLRNLKIF